MGNKLLRQARMAAEDQAEWDLINSRIRSIGDEIGARGVGLLYCRYCFLRAFGKPSFGIDIRVMQNVPRIYWYPVRSENDIGPGYIDITRRFALEPDVLDVPIDVRISFNHQSFATLDGDVHHITLKAFRSALDTVTIASTSLDAFLPANHPLRKIIDSAARYHESAQQGDAPESATNATPASSTPIPPAR